MPYLDKIISTLNDKWTGSSLSFIPTVKAYGISEAMYDVDKNDKLVKYPAIIDESGDAVMIVPDDTYAMIMYHVLESISNTVVPRSGFGDSPGDQLETVNMSLVVIAFRSKVKKPAHVLESVLKDGMADRIRLSDNSGGFLQGTTFRAGNSSFDKMSLLNREYTGEVEIDYPNILLFEMKYRIENTWQKGCLNKCDC